MEKIVIFYSLVLIVAVILISFLVFVIRRNKTKNLKKSEINKKEFEEIANAINLENILKIEKTQDRIKITLNDKKLVDVKVLQDLKITASFKGNELTILYRENSDKLFEYLRGEF